MELNPNSELEDSSIRLRQNPKRLKEKVLIGCGAGFAGDRPSAAVKLLRQVDGLDYIVLECLAERTLADRYQSMIQGRKGYDPRISEWMEKLLPLTVEKRVCVITNMGAMDPVGAQKETLEVACKLGITVSVAIAYEVSVSSSGSKLIHEDNYHLEGGVSTYLGAAPIVQCLERYKPRVVITSRVADAALFLAPLVYELGWNWNNYELLAQGAVAGHLLECGCQLTGGYFMHPGDENRSLSHEQLLDISLPYAEINHAGELFIGKAEGSGGLLDKNTCAQQLLYEIGDPASYITPDVVIDLRDVTFCPLSDNKVLCHGAKASDLKIPDKLLRLVPLDCGWKGWGEISYGGYGCLKRAEAAEYLVRSWMEETYPEVADRIISYVIGYDSIKASNNRNDEEHIRDIRLRMDGLFDLKEHATRFTDEFIALYTNGPAAGGGIITGNKKEIILQKELVDRKQVFWTSSMKQTPASTQCSIQSPTEQSKPCKNPKNMYTNNAKTCNIAPAPSNKKILLHEVAHSRAGDKGDDINFSIIPHYPQDIEKLKLIITPSWVKNAVSVLFRTSSFTNSKAVNRNDEMVEKLRVEIYEVRGINSLNVVVRNVLDGGVNCSRRIDRHGKTISDLVLCQEIILP